MIVKFIAWRLAVAAAFAVCVALIHAAPAAAAEKETAARGAKTTGTPVARVHTLLGASLDVSRPIRKPARTTPASTPVEAEATAAVRASADGVVLADGSFALFANY